MVERIFYSDVDVLEPLFKEAYGDCVFSRAAATQNIDQPFNPSQVTFALKEDEGYIGFINIWLDSDWYEIDEYPQFHMTARLNCIFITEAYRSLTSLKRFVEEAVGSLTKHYLFPMEWYRCSPDPVFAEDEDAPDPCRTLILNFDAELHSAEQESLFNTFRDSLSYAVHQLCEKSPEFFFEPRSVFVEHNINYHY